MCSIEPVVRNGRPCQFLLLGFVANFVRFSAVQKKFENRLMFDKATENQKVGTS